MSRDRLGRGLGALLGDYLAPQEAPADTRRLPLSAIVPNPLQPRRVFSDAELAELVESIRENGLLQPLVVRPAPGAAERYELVVGERRFRAVTRLGWEDVPVVVREADDETLLVLALVENLQREALNPIEEAEGYAALADRYALGHAEIAKAVGKDRSTVANVLRLLKLPPSLRKLVEEGALSQGHARALLAVEDTTVAADLGRRAAAEGWSVRELERRAGTRKRRAKSRKAKAKSAVLEALEQALEEHLMTRVEVTEGRGGKGTISIGYHGSEDFARLFELITGRTVEEVVE
ncbi:MAG TPA: ParB/RepB/Spo0J family partition protein [Longimicrobiales bacterium]|nr:ParB/RepB/Spo0J family partition protein [Longimicrobiales bacterium]